MSKQILAIKLGLEDQAPTSAEDGQVTVIDLVAGQRRLGFGIGNVLDDLKKLGIFPTEVGLDLYVLASMVYAADTRISRETESQDSWTREIRIVLPVRDVDLWTSAIPLVVEILNFLTGDRWELEFCERPEGFSRLGFQSPVNHSAPSYSNVSLFSGGLDSLIGAIDQTEAGQRPLLVSHAGDGAASAAQKACLEGLRKARPERRIDHVRFWLQFEKNLLAGVEDTTRSRSFLFIAAALATGTGLSGEFTLRIPENGLIALNVPLDPNRLGSLSTRTTHPYYLSKWRELAKHLGIECTLVNPYWNKTKGEMAAECGSQKLLKSLLTESLSCSSPAKARWQGCATQHCGYCLPCLIRRAALAKAFGETGDPTTYTKADLRAKPLNTKKSEGQQVRSFQVAIDRLQSRPGIAKALIHKSGPLSGDFDELADVYRRGMEELAVFLEGVVTKPL